MQGFHVEGGVGKISTILGVSSFTLPLALELVVA
jgi:hypothetical protein